MQMWLYPAPCSMWAAMGRKTQGRLALFNFNYFGTVFGHQRALSYYMPAYHYWPNDLCDERRNSWVLLDNLTAKSWCEQGNAALLLNTQMQRACVNIYLICVQSVGRDLSSPLVTSLWLVMHGARLHECRYARGTNKRLSEKSSHCATVNCQPWYEAEASFACW